MSEKAKQFIKQINQDQALYQEFFALSDQLKGSNDRQQILLEHILPFAKRHGFDLSAEDFSSVEGEMDESELAAIAGGGGCGCVVGGGGSGTQDVDGDSYTCACVLSGMGGGPQGDDGNCICPVVGGGTDAGF